MTATITSGTGTDTSYQWQFYNVNTSTWINIPGATNSTYVEQFLGSGMYQYQLLVVLDAGCEATSNTITINVEIDPDVNVTADDIEICEGGTATLTASVSGGNGADTYVWEYDHPSTG